jgi:hypothetical protein
MLTGEYLEETGGKIRIHRTYEGIHDILVNKERRKDIGKGFTESREMRHAYSVPGWLQDVDPYVSAFVKNPNDKLAKRIALERYPWIKVCDGNTR